MKSSKQRITYQNEEFLIGKGTIQFSVLLTTQGEKKKLRIFFFFLSAVEQDSRLSHGPPKHREGIFVMVL